MKSTGVIRRVDELGRVVIPIELRTQFGISEKDPMEIYVDGSSIILRKYEPKPPYGQIRVMHGITPAQWYVHSAIPLTQLVHVYNRTTFHP